MDVDIEYLHRSLVFAKDRLTSVRNEIDRERFSSEGAKMAARDIGQADGKVLSVRLELRNRVSEQSEENSPEDGIEVDYIKQLRRIDRHIQNAGRKIDALVPESEEMSVGQLENERHDSCEREFQSTLLSFKNEEDESLFDRWDMVSTAGSAASALLPQPIGAATGVTFSSLPIFSKLYLVFFDDDLTTEEFAIRYLVRRELYETLDPVILSMSIQRGFSQVDPWSRDPFGMMEIQEAFFSQFEQEIEYLHAASENIDDIHRIPKAYYRTSGVEMMADTEPTDGDPPTNLAFMTGRKLGLTVYQATIKKLTESEINWDINSETHADVEGRATRHQKSTNDMGDKQQRRDHIRNQISRSAVKLNSLIENSS